MATKNNCETCPVHQSAYLKKLGVNMESWDYVLALAGNPNTGKSTVFNALTGLRQHTGNWPGKTVTRAEGGFDYNDQRFKIVDLPGTYSLLSTSTDEEIARNFILFGKPDVTVIVMDATRLERNLNLALQVLEITDRAVICLNLMDEARRHKIQINDQCQGVQILADSMLHQMFYNLFDNSLRHGKHVDQIQIYFKPRKSSLELIYQDNGIGVSTIEKVKIFEKGYGLGSGFGLYLIKKMCEVYGWTIKETGKPGKGAQFTISIPKLNEQGRANYKLN